MTTAMTTLARGDGSGIVERRRTIVRDQSEWRALWAAHAGPADTAPVVDFSAQMVAAAFAGERPTPGYEIEIGGTGRDGAALTIAVEERAPDRGMMAAQMIVTPFHIVTLARHDGDVRFVDGAVGTVAAPPHARRSSPAPHAQEFSSTGLDPNVAAALAYLAGPFSAVLMLLAERTSTYVRFHAWQSILALGGLGVLAAATLFLSFLTLLLSPLVFTLMYRLSAVMACVWLAVWAICLVKAFTGSRWKLPLVGHYAERRASRAG
jgi:uncharacterized membrane protein